MWRRSAASALVEQENVIHRRVEEPPVVRGTPSARPAMQEHGWLAPRGTDALPMEDVAVADLERADLVRVDRRVQRA